MIAYLKKLFKKILDFLWWIFVYRPIKRKNLYFPTEFNKIEFESNMKELTDRLNELSLAVKNNTFSTEDIKGIWSEKNEFTNPQNNDASEDIYDAETQS